MILERLSRLPIQTWSYRWDDPRIRHIGPMAQDFSRLFGVGDHRGIHTGDALGVAYASIQALHGMAHERSRELAKLRRELNRLQAEIRRRRGRR